MAKAAIRAGILQATVWLSALIAATNFTLPCDATPSTPTPASAFSVITKRGGLYAWERFTLGLRDTQIIAKFPSPSVVAGWSSGLKRALVRSIDLNELSEVELSTGRNRWLDSPDRGVIDTLGYDAKDRPIALTLEQVPYERQEMDKPYLTLEGKRYPRLSLGDSAFVHAYRLEGSRWIRLETAVTRIGVDSAPGIGVMLLKISRALTWSISVD